MITNSRIGTYVTQQIAHESYKAYIPPKLPPCPPLNLEALYPSIDRATRALAELSSITNPNFG